jgi:hypothetical protein
MIADRVGIDKMTVHTIITEDLAMRIHKNVSVLLSASSFASIEHVKNGSSGPEFV